MMKHMVMAACKANVLMLLMFVAPALSGNTMAGPLRYDYYSSSCPKAEAVVRKTTGEIITKDPTMGAAFLLMFYFDCFPQGCDASLLLDETEKEPWVERSWMSRYLRASVAVDEIKAAVEAICPGVVSCADIITLAARDSTTISGGFTFPMPTGRRDALVSIVYDDFMHAIPFPYSTLEDLIDSFAIRGLNVDDMVALSGAHSFGISHCRGVNRRLETVDPTMNATYADELRKACSPPYSGSVPPDGPALNNNRVTDPNKLSNQYYNNVLTGQVLFQTDQELTSRNDTAAMVAYYAANPLVWKVHFAAALVKMGRYGVLTGTQGEVRKVCNAIN